LKSALLHVILRKNKRFWEYSLEKNQKSSRKSHLSLILRLAIAAAASWIIFKDLDFTQLAGTFRRLHITVLVLAVIAFALGQSMVGLRWWLVLMAQSIRVPLFFAIKLTFLGHFFSQFMPSSVGGDLVRAWYVSRHSDKKLQAALGVAVDRIVGLVSTFLLAFGSYCLFMRDQNIFETGQKVASYQTWLIQPKYFLSTVLSSILILTGLVLVLMTLSAFKKLLYRLYRHILHFFTQFKEVLKVYYHHPAIFFVGVLITVFLQSMIILSYWAVGLDLEMKAPSAIIWSFSRWSGPSAPFPSVWLALVFWKGGWSFCLLNLPDVILKPPWPWLSARG
jgi:uncharacterized membrane protein YbhN (UPF0104 family)